MNRTPFLPFAIEPSLQPCISREQINEKLGNPEYAANFGSYWPCDEMVKLFPQWLLHPLFTQKRRGFSRDSLGKSDQASASDLWMNRCWEKGREARFFYKTDMNGGNSLKWKASNAFQVEGLRDCKAEDRTRKTPEDGLERQATSCVYFLFSAPYKIFRKTVFSLPWVTDFTLEESKCGWSLLSVGSRRPEDALLEKCLHYKHEVLTFTLPFLSLLPGHQDVSSLASSWDPSVVCISL